MTEEKSTTRKKKTQLEESKTPKSASKLEVMPCLKNQNKKASAKTSNYHHLCFKLIFIRHDRGEAVQECSL